MKSKNSQKNTEKLYQAMTDIPDSYITEAEEHEFTACRTYGKKTAPRFSLRYTAPLAAALCLSMLLGIFFWPTPMATSAYALVEAQYPQMAPYPYAEDFYDSEGIWDDEAFFQMQDAWLEDQALQDRPFGFAEGLDSFFVNSAQQFLTDLDGENRVYSPLNLYLAMGMLAEISEGDTREQILQVLGSDTIETLRQQASDLWNASYNDDGFYTSVLASSLWLNEDFPVNETTMQTLADSYYASSFSGPMGSRKFDKALQNWMNEHTNHLLEEDISDLEFTPTTLLSIATTIAYESSWSNEFLASETA